MWEGNAVSKEEASLWASQLFFSGRCCTTQSYQSTFSSVVSASNNIATYLCSHAQAHYCLSGCDTSDSYGKKLLLFLKWKWMEAKVVWRYSIVPSEKTKAESLTLIFLCVAHQAVAYYYHGLVLDKGGEPANHISAVCCLSAADDLLSDSKRACLSFCLANPVTRSGTDPTQLIGYINQNACWRDLLPIQLHVGCLLHGVSWKTCTKRSQMSLTRSSKRTGICLSKTRTGKSILHVKYGKF